MFNHMYYPTANDENDVLPEDIQKSKVVHAFNLLDFQPSGQHTTTGWTQAIQTAMFNRKRRKVKRSYDTENPKRSLFLFNKNNIIRKLCLRIVEWKYPFSSILRLRKFLGDAFSLRCFEQLY
ncbi:hypothetical protein GJ496_007719 [Pomphorhynchus laevis]|nr:hypothetical protein GJ496_007719 [Pomphorhynchus laevis]